MAPPAAPRLHAVIHGAATALIAAGSVDDLDEGRLEAELLYGEAAGWDRARVLAAGATAPAPATLAAFEALLGRRLAHEPLAYIRGRREFFGMMLAVGPGALVPRPETELLVELALDAIARHPRGGAGLHVADVGTGSGAVAIAIARHAPGVRVTAIDASDAALRWAARNVERWDLGDRVTLCAGDLLTPLREPVDVLVANLPYIPTADLPGLPAAVGGHEPRAALDGGADGLTLVERLLATAPGHLAGDAWACALEVGAGQAARTAARATAALGAGARTHPDLAGIDRVVTAERGLRSGSGAKPRPGGDR